VTSDARVFEVHEPSDWVSLVNSYPSTNPVGYRPDWERWSGIAGPWIVPNWGAFAAEWDAVHVSIGGYVATNTVAREVDAGFTLFAGAAPDRTIWLNDGFRLKSTAPKYRIGMGPFSVE
jgi:hypothetical protein